MANKQIKILRRTSEFAKIRELGKTHQSSKWMFVAYLPNDLEDSRYGWTVGRRVGSAVVRNKLKRWCREFFRSRDGSLKISLDINVIFKSQDGQFYKDLKFTDFEKSLERSWKSMAQLS